MRRAAPLVAAVAAAAAGVAVGGAGTCPALPAPGTMARPHLELPSAEQPVRQAATTGYTLALSWAPEFCRAHGAGLATTQPGSAECGGAYRDRFVLHGLWPDGDGANRWPEFCRPAGVIDEAAIRQGFCDSPSAQLLQHEWAKHGTCTAAADAGTYFAEEDRLFEAVRWPDMAALARRSASPDGLTAGAFQQAFAAANPGMRPDGMRLNVGRDGRLEEVWLCLGPDKAARSCPAGQGGAAPGTRITVTAPG